MEYFSLKNEVKAPQDRYGYWKEGKRSWEVFPRPIWLLKRGKTSMGSLPKTDMVTEKRENVHGKSPQDRYGY